MEQPPRGAVVLAVLGILFGICGLVWFGGQHEATEPREVHWEELTAPVEGYRCFKHDRGVACFPVEDE